MPIISGSKGESALQPIPASIYEHQRMPLPGVDSGQRATEAVGGVWDIDSQYSNMYESAHLISSKNSRQ